MKQETNGDSVVDDVYAIREEIVEECGYDLQRIDDQAHETADKIPGLKYIALEDMRERKKVPTHQK